MLIFIGGIFLCGILAAIMSTADSQLLVTASAVSEDLYKGAVKRMQAKRVRFWSAKLQLQLLL